MKIKKKYYKVYYIDNGKVYERYFLRSVNAYKFYESLKTDAKTISIFQTSDTFISNVDYIPLF